MNKIGKSLKKRKQNYLTEKYFKKEEFEKLIKEYDVDVKILMKQEKKTNELSNFNANSKKNA